MAAPRPSTPLAGGFLLALSLMVGGIAGMAQGQASLGIVIGFAVGVALAGLVWAAERMRR